MLSVNQAIERLRAAAQPLHSPHPCALADALGRVLAEDVFAGLDVPPADNSAMDGYALRSADWQGGVESLPVSQRITAGSVPQPLAAASAARIFTGAEIPPGADTVVMQENCTEQGARVKVNTLPAPNSNIRPRGQDIRSGQCILPAGQRLRAQDLGLLASVGIASVPVQRRLRVAIISNGDELVEPGSALRPGQIYNSNRYLLRGLCAQWGFETLDFGIAPDDPSSISALFARAADEADVIISSGGVSVGEEDHVKAVVAELGQLDLWKVAIKPGKPLAFGQVKATPFLGLPGNPASVLVTALVVARPFLFDCQGASDALPGPVALPAGFTRAGGSRQEYLRARFEDGRLALYPNQSSGVLLSASWGNGLVVQYPYQDIGETESVDFLPYALLG
jgi:molybdopterin molybdotransferase